MPVVSTAVQNAWLDLYLRTAGPTSLDLALFNGDPADGGTELDSDGGYARVTIARADWSPAADGSIVTAAEIDFPDATDAYSDIATHWCLIDGSDLGPAGQLDSEVEVTGAGPVALASITVFFADTVVADDSDS